MITQSNAGILALDIGSGRLAGVVGTLTDKGFQVLSTGSNSHPTGFAKGKVVDFEQAKVDIKQTIARICYTSSVSIQYLLLNIHLKDSGGFNFCHNGLMYAKDIDSLPGEQLYMYQKLASQLNIELLGFVPDALAISKILLKESEKKRGVVLLDCGQNMTRGAVYIDGACCHLFELPLGGRHITNDIAYGLSVEQKEAEGIKIRYSKDPDDLELAVSKEFIGEIISARLREIFSLTYKELRSYLAEDNMKIILTGGMSKTRGVLESAKSCFHTDVLQRYYPAPDSAITVGSEWEIGPTGLLSHAAESTAIRKKLEVIDFATVYVPRVSIKDDKPVKSDIPAPSVYSKPVSSPPGHFEKEILSPVKINSSFSPAQSSKDSLVRKRESVENPFVRTVNGTPVEVQNSKGWLSEIKAVFEEMF